MSAAASGANAADQKAAQGRPEDFLGEPLIFGMPQAAVWQALTAVIMLHVPGPRAMQCLPQFSASNPW